MAKDEIKTKKQITKGVEGSVSGKHVTNPVDIVAQINSIAPKNTANKLYGGYNNYFNKSGSSINYADFLRKLCEIIATPYGSNEFYLHIHDLLINNFNISLYSYFIFAII